MWIYRVLATALLLWGAPAFAETTTLQNAVTANATGGNLAVADKGAVGLSVTISGTATVTFQGSADGGTTFNNIYCTAVASTTNVSSTTSTNQYQCAAAGLTHIQAPVSGCSGCTVTVKASSSLASLGGAGGGGGGGGGGGTQYNEDAGHASGDTGTMALCVRQSTATDLSAGATNGDYEPCQVDATGRLWANTEMPDAAALADNTSNPTAPGVAAFLMCWDSTGSNWDRCMAGLTDTDDGTVAGSQVPTLNLGLNYRYDGSNWKRAGYDPCDGPKTVVPISINTATTTQLVAADASNKVYVCSIQLGPTAGAQNAALVEDNDAACASPSAGMAGGTTAATGWNFAANGGLVLGTGGFTVAKTASTNRYVCLITSAAQQISGVMTYVLYP